MPVLTHDEATAILERAVIKYVGNNPGSRAPQVVKGMETVIEGGGDVAIAVNRLKTLHIEYVIGQMARGAIEKRIVKS